MLQTKVAQLTPSGASAIAVVEVRGPNAVEAVSQFFLPRRGSPLSAITIDDIVLGRWGGDDGEELIVCKTQPDVVEIHPHGGAAAVSRVVDDLCSAGCERVSWEESLRATTGDSWLADAEIALCRAPTERTAVILLNQVGAWQRALDAVRTALAAQDIPTASDIVETLLQRVLLGTHLTTPWSVVLTGSPNVGKSSLINALLGTTRAIVHNTPGTTRDVVSSVTAFEGWPVELADTAGIRTGADTLEQAGIEVATKKLASADLILVVDDGCQSDTKANEDCLDPFWKQFSPPCGILRVRSKCDLATDRNRPHGLPENTIITSAKTGEGIDKLISSIATRLVPEKISEDDAVPIGDAQRRLLIKLRKALQQGHANEARAILT